MSVKNDIQKQELRPTFPPLRVLVLPHARAGDRARTSPRAWVSARLGHARVQHQLPPRLGVIQVSGPKSCFF